MDVAIPIVFPDYRITVDIKPQKVDLLPGSTWDDFTIDTCRAAGIDTPWSLDPRPNAYIGEFRDEFPDLDYYPRTRELKLELEDEAA